MATLAPVGVLHYMQDTTTNDKAPSFLDVIWHVAIESSDSCNGDHTIGQPCLLKRILQGIHWMVCHGYCTMAKCTMTFHTCSHLDYHEIMTVRDFFFLIRCALSF